MASFKDALSATKTQSAPKSAKKSTVPTLEGVPEEIVKAAKTYVGKVKEKKQIEADISLFGSDIIEYVGEIQDQKAFKGEFHNSYVIPFDDTGLMVTTKNSFSIDKDTIPKIKSLFGDRFPEFITEKVEAPQLRPEVMESEALQEELMALIGDNFAKFFVTPMTYKVVEDFDEKIFGFSKTSKKLAEIRALIAPAKPTLK